MDRLWAVSAAIMLWMGVAAAYFGAYLMALGGVALAVAILALLAFDEVCVIAGPVNYLRSGRVWSITLGRVRIWGITWRVRFGRVAG